MRVDQRDILASIKNFDQLIVYLRDEMGWPIEFSDLEELTFDYTPEELGIDEKNAAKIQSIKRLRPLSTRQPWGIFFIKFEPKKLPVVALRRILSKVTLKKRASANSAERTAWSANDLLFISNYGEGNNRTITFAHFSQDDKKRDLPILKVLGWNYEDTALHLDGVATELTSKLAWPTNESNVETWRKQWRLAFTVGHREVITTSKDLSIQLAKLAQNIRNRIKKILTIETKHGPLTTLMKAFKDALIHDLDAEGFADMYAQTIAYGLLSARITNPQSSTVDDLHIQIPVTNPFLKELLEMFLHIGGRRGETGGPRIDFDELGISEIIELLNIAKMDAVIRDFGDRNPLEDPVIHFYELFLTEYDPKKRLQRGVFYTPRPVVSYIVRSVDGLLRSEFGLQDGLADTTTWDEMAKRHKDLIIPDSISPDQVFVQILDPATGTGTFLVETINVIFHTMQVKWRKQGYSEKKIEALWNEYVPKHLLPRLHGYELLMAPYTIAHLKIGLKLFETGYRFSSEERVRIYLTNSLEQASDIGQLKLTEIFDAIANEAQMVNKIKRTQRFTVIIGNPPYANYSANLSPQMRRIVDKYRSYRGNLIRERNQLQFERNIQDDFVKFLSVGEDLILTTNVGILSYITNGTMLASRSLRGMREHLTKNFNILYEINLHGGLNEIITGVTDDENVFEIIQSVAIHAYVRSIHSDSNTIHYADLIGRRNQKYSALLSQTVLTTESLQILPDSENHSFKPQDDDDIGSKQRIDSIFVKFGAGIKTNRDAIVIGFNDDNLIKSVGDYNPQLIVDASSRDHIYSLLYRPFDIRRIFYHKTTVASRSLPTMKHMIAGPNIGLIGSSTWTTPERFSVNISRTMVEMKTGTHDRGTTFFPLYLYKQTFSGKAERMHNFTQEFVSAWSNITKTQFIAESGDLQKTSGPEDVLFWLYGLFHSPEYRQRYRAALSQGFPLILLSSNKKLLRELVRLGGELIDLHLLESQKVMSSRDNFIGDRNLKVEKIVWANETVWIDKAQTAGFKDVPETVWNLRIGGYPVCMKWLKDRKGRLLSKEDRAHYQKIVVSLTETILLMKEIDEVINHHGGWPGAFQKSQEKQLSSGR